MRKLADVLYLQAEAIVAVMEHLNIHSPIFSYESFELDEARQNIDRFEYLPFLSTNVHSTCFISRLNMVVNWTSPKLSWKS